MAGEEQNTFGRRVRRYAQVGGTMSGIAVRLASEKYLGAKVDRERMAEDLKASLGGLKGPLMKVAQILSTIPEALPKEYARELAHLQSNAPHMGWAFVKRRMSGELGKDWQGRYAEFSREAAAAASLGQVHKGRLHDGRQVACKLQYPDMESVVEADLKQLDLIVSVYRRYDQAIDPTLLKQEIGERLREELDYAREARHIRLYEHILKDEPEVAVPEVIGDLSTRRLLTMTWLDGQPMLSFREVPQEVRNRIAMSMFKAWYVPFYRAAVIHGDPHLGNYTVRADHGVNLLDFGCIRVFSPAFVEGVLDLYKALRDDDIDLAVKAYSTWGFENLSNDMIEVLNQWASFIYAPLMEDRTRLIEETNSGQYGREVATKVHAELRNRGGVRPPREFVLMDRAAIGLGSVFLHLRAEINWHRLFNELIEDFDVAHIGRRQAEALRLSGLSPSSDSAA